MGSSGLNRSMQSLHPRELGQRGGKVECVKSQDFFGTEYPMHVLLHCDSLRQHIYDSYTHLYCTQYLLYSVQKTVN